jgi:hypothetical protein
MLRIPVLICGMAGIALLAGCADAPAQKVASTPPAPASPWIRDTRGNVVTLASLTGKNPQIGQTEGLADSTPGATALEAASSYSDSSDVENLEIVGDGLKGKLAVLRVGAARNDSNLLSVFAGVKNETSRRLEVQMQTLYRDKDGNSLSDGHASWIPLTLKPHEQTQYRSVALTPDATDFLVRIRHAPSASEPEKPSDP